MNWLKQANTVYGCSLWFSVAISQEHLQPKHSKKIPQRVETPMFMFIDPKNNYSINKPYNLYRVTVHTAKFII